VLPLDHHKFISFYLSFNPYKFVVGSVQICKMIDSTIKMPQTSVS